MKNIFVGILLASVFTLPAEAGNSNNNSGHHGSGGGGSGGYGGGSAPAAGSSSSSTANGGGGGAGGTGTGGSATGGAATGGSASGGQSNASGNTSTVSVLLTNGSSSGSSSGGTDPNTSTVKYDGSYTVKSAPPIAAPSLTSTFSDTCMGSASFGLSFVGFGATGGSTIVDEACVRRLDSREFRAMGLNDVALALLCQSDANRKAVEAAGHACPSATAPVATAAAAPVATLALTSAAPIQTQANQQVSLALPAETPLPAQAPQAPEAPQPAPVPALPPVAAADTATLGAVPEQPRVAAMEIKPLAAEAGGK